MPKKRKEKKVNGLHNLIIQTDVSYNYYANW